MTTTLVAHTTTRAARIVILVGCLLAYAGILLPWTSNVLTIDLAKNGFLNGPVLVYGLSAAILSILSLSLLLRLTYALAIFALVIGFVESIVVISLRSNLTDPGLGLYILPAGLSLIMLGGLMTLAYPARPIS